MERWRSWLVTSSVRVSVNNDGCCTSRIEPHMRRGARHTQHDTIASRATHDRSHPMGVDDQGANRPRHSATTAFRARGGQIRDKYLAQYSGRGISVDSSRVGKALARNSWLSRYLRSTFHCCPHFTQINGLVAI